jgi:hypothetical protein
MNLAADAVISLKKLAAQDQFWPLFKLSTKTVDNFVDLFGELAPSHGAVRILSLCRNIKQQTKPF